MRDLDAYLVGLQIMGRCLKEAPAGEFLQGLREMAEHAADWPGVLQKDAEKLRDALGWEPPALASALAADHLRLFSGPNPLAPPWESVWLERDKLLFGERTRQVADIYNDWGVEIANTGHEPEDHMGLELGFMAWLLQLAANEPDSSSQTGKSPKESLKDFLNAHALAFAPDFFEKAAENAESDFYKIACGNCLAMLRQLKADLDGM